MKSSKKGSIQPPLKPDDPALVPPPPRFNFLDFIAGGITDRDAPSLYDENANGRGKRQLLEEKIELEDSGHDDYLRDVEFVREKSVLFAAVIHAPKPVVFANQAVFTNVAIPQLLALVDAVDADNKILARLVKVDEDGFRRAQGSDEVRGGKVPEWNWIEIQHQLTVIGYDKGYFVAVCGDDFYPVAVKRDAIFCSNHVAECIALWDKVRRGELPPDPNQDSFDLEPPLQKGDVV